MRLPNDFELIAGHEGACGDEAARDDAFTGGTIRFIMKKLLIAISNNALLAPLS